MRRLALLLCVLIVMAMFAANKRKQLHSGRTEDELIEIYLQSSKPPFASPPESVGTAYETSPLPLASLDGILGTKPTLDDLQLYVKSFARIAFEREHYQRYPWIRKWAELVPIKVAGEIEAQHDDLLQRVVGDLSLVTGLPFGVDNLPDEVTAIYPGVYVFVSDIYIDRSPRGYCFGTLSNAREDGSLIFQGIVVSTNIQGDALVS